MVARIACLFLLICLSSCSGGKGGESITTLFGDGSNPASNSEGNPEVPANIVETAKLQEAIKAEPEYKIDNADLEALKAEGIIEEEDLAKIQAIQ